MHALTHSQPMNDMDMYSGWPMSYKHILGDLNKGLLDDQFLKEQEYLDLLHVGHDKLDHHEHEDEEYEEENLEEYEEHIHDHLEDHEDDEERYLADLRGTSIDSALLHDTVDHAWNLDAGQKHLKQSTLRPLIYHDNNLVKDHDVVHDEDEEEDLEEYEKHIHDNLEDHEDDKDHDWVYDEEDEEEDHYEDLEDHYEDLEDHYEDHEEKYPADLRGTFIDSALLHDSVDYAWNLDGRKHLKQSTQRPLIYHDNLVKDHDGVYDEEDEEEDHDYHEDHYEDREDDYEDHEERYPADLRGTSIDSALLHDTVDHAWNLDYGQKHLKQSTQRPLIYHDNLVKHGGVGFIREMPGHPKNYRHLHEEPDTYSQRINKHMPSQSKATLHMLGKQPTAKYMLDHPSNRAYGHLTNDKDILDFNEDELEDEDEFKHEYQQKGDKKRHKR